jgi:hypothetical protein
MYWQSVWFEGPAPDWARDCFLFHTPRPLDDRMSSGISPMEPAMTSTKSLEQRLAAAAKKANRDRDAVQAMKEYAAEKARVDANTLRLRAMRLEKEAADAKAEAEAAAQKKPRATKAARASTRSGTSA